jgi:type III restriction enzyme
MNRIANAINNRLSLRPPQSKSLEILSVLADKLTLKKNPDMGAELEKVKELYPTCTDFERFFPSFAFGIATGVGKTRLMGAFITYLYLEKGIKNFFVMAPNLTIYNKLYEDFSNPNHPKYVFKGIGEFTQKAPRVVTGDNYESQGDIDFYADVTINIFNISKLNSETRAGKEPKIKRMSECLGESYFKYLANLEDLVLLMDESHHYRADRGMAVINELNPILGLELTATPKTEQGGRSINFKNVVYEYSLAKAIRDGFVKQPAVATRKDFNPDQYRNAQDELDRIKIEDGIRIHADTKVALDIYARNNKVNQVKPFVLVVAKETAHASKLKELIVSKSFFGGYYADKVMEIHSNQTGAEKEENITQLLSLENPSNKIEIVIHVNMLKEGWDVTNLYTIIPLRASASETLTEQTMGRGLRLPYKVATGDPKVDKLTIVSHDKFQAILDKANEPDSIIKKENIIVIEATDLNQPKEVISSLSNTEQKLQEETKEVEAIVNPEKKQIAENALRGKKEVLNIIQAMNKDVRSVNDLTKPEIKKVAIEKLKTSVEGDLFSGEIIREAEKAYNDIAKEFASNIIEIPRITIQQSDEVRSGFKDFDLDTGKLSFQPVSEEIIRKTLSDNKMDIVIGKGRIIEDSLENLLVSELMNHPEVDYDEQSMLLFKLASQAVDKFESYLDENGVQNVAQYFRRDIANFIYTQMMENIYYETPEYQDAKVMPFTRIEQHNFSKYSKDSIHDFRETINPTKAIPTKVFSGFKKACHGLYKFDSKTEKDFTIILEDDKDVIKWLRPASNQFHIYWAHNSKQYEPDFVVETKDGIFLIETKKEDDIDSGAVQEKAQAAIKYCSSATKYTTQNKGKPWKYILIPHNAVMQNMGFKTLAMKYEVK